MKSPPPHPLSFFHLWSHQGLQNKISKKDDVKWDTWSPFTVFFVTWCISYMLKSSKISSLLSSKMEKQEIVHFLKKSTTHSILSGSKTFKLSIAYNLAVHYLKMACIAEFVIIFSTYPPTFVKSKLTT